MGATIAPGKVGTEQVHTELAKTGGSGFAPLFHIIHDLLFYRDAESAVSSIHVRLQADQFGLPGLSLFVYSPELHNAPTYPDMCGTTADVGHGDPLVAVAGGSEKGLGLKQALGASAEAAQVVAKAGARYYVSVFMGPRIKRFLKNAPIVVNHQKFEGKEMLAIMLTFRRTNALAEAKGAYALEKPAAEKAGDHFVVTNMLEAFLASENLTMAHVTRPLDAFKDRNGLGVFVSALKPDMFELAPDGDIVLADQPQRTLRQELPRSINARAIGGRSIHINDVVVDMHATNPMSQRGSGHMELTLEHPDKGEVVLTVVRDDAVTGGDWGGGVVLPCIGFVNLTGCRDLMQRKVSERMNNQVSLSKNLGDPANGEINAPFAAELCSAARISMLPAPVRKFVRDVIAFSATEEGSKRGVCVGILRFVFDLQQVRLLADLRGLPPDFGTDASKSALQSPETLTEFVYRHALTDIWAWLMRSLPPVWNDPFQAYLATIKEKNKDSAKKKKQKTAVAQIGPHALRPAPAGVPSARKDTRPARAAGEAAKQNVKRVLEDAATGEKRARRSEQAEQAPQEPAPKGPGCSKCRWGATGCRTCAKAADKDVVVLDDDDEAPEEEPAAAAAAAAATPPPTVGAGVSKAKPAPSSKAKPRGEAGLLARLSAAEERVLTLQKEVKDLNKAAGQREAYIAQLKARLAAHGEAPSGDEGEGGDTSD